MMADLFYESTESVNEGRAFINAAKKAKAEGKTEFEFNGKTYPVTIKD
jgi:citrate lyase beta subunit